MHASAYLAQHTGCITGQPNGGLGRECELTRTSSLPTERDLRSRRGIEKDYSESIRLGEYHKPGRKCDRAFNPVNSSFRRCVPLASALRLPEREHS